MFVCLCSSGCYIWLCGIMFGLSRTSQSWAQMRREGKDGIYHTYRGSIGSPSGGEKKQKKNSLSHSFTQEYQPPHINKDWRVHTQPHTMQLQAIKQLSEEQAQRIGSRIVLRSAIVKGVCCCCFIKVGLDAEFSSG